MIVRAQRVDFAGELSLIDDPDILEGYLEDASGVPAGRARALLRPADEAEAAAFLRRFPGAPVLCQAARSSLTGGAVPQGETVLSVERMNGCGPVRERRIRVEPGLPLDELQRRLAPRGLYYPPVPTFERAQVGGAVSTNAGGAASFKYGVTRDWVHGLRVLLFNGDAIEIERGQAVARPGETIDVRLADGRVLAVPVPDYRVPALKKVSAGYHASDPFDLVDLFVGAEGTLGLITAITLDLAPLPQGVVTGLVFMSGSKPALALCAALRDAADPAGPDVRSIEWLDAACLHMLREKGAAARLRVRIPDGARVALLFEMELREPVSRDRAVELLYGGAEDPLGRLGRILGRHRAVNEMEVALPGDDPRRRALLELREAAPAGFGEELARRRLERPGVAKVGGDLIVPFEHLESMLELYRRGFAERGLQYAIWGHASDGNLHPNALPRNAEETRLGFEALYEFADAAVRYGGCPLSEHGVGRHPVKQEILRRFLGAPALETMRRIKRALDPESRFAPGVLFPPA